MKIIRCGRGHPYSENLTECPICANELSMIQFDDPPYDAGAGADDAGDEAEEADDEGGSDSIVERIDFAEGDTEPPGSDRGGFRGGNQGSGPRDVSTPSVVSRTGGWFTRDKGSENRSKKDSGPIRKRPGGQEPSSRPSSGPAIKRDAESMTPPSGDPRKPANPPQAPRPVSRPAPRSPELGERDPVDHIDRVRVHAADRRQLLAAAFLVMLDGSEPGRFYAIFEGVNSIGKASNPENSVQIPSDKFVSRCHAELEYRAADGAVFLLRDLGSSNGTYLNDDPRRVCPEEDVALLPGDVVRIGRTRLRFMPIFP